MTQSSLISELSRRYPGEFSEGADIAASVIDGVESEQLASLEIDDLRQRTAHEVAAQKIVGEGRSDVEAVLILVSADSVINEFFANRMELTV